MKKSILQMIVGWSFATLLVVCISAQPESGLNGVKRLPKGVTLAKLKAHVIEPTHTRNIKMEEAVKERVVVADPASPKSGKVKPSLNVQKFCNSIESALKDKVAGYMLQVRRLGSPVCTEFWKGARNSPGDLPVLWNENAQMHVASVSKFLTAVALVKLLDQRHISYDTPIIGFLPFRWTKGNNIEKITFRHLLRHESGFSTGGSRSDYTFMKDRVAAGVPKVGSYEYENMNFGLMRILIPIINGDVIKEANLADPLFDGITIAFYSEYMLNNVFIPAGVNNPSFEKNSANSALAYPPPPLGGALPGWDSGDLATMAGGAAWRLTTKQLLDVMNHVRRKNTIISSQKAQYMLENHFGIDQTIETLAGSLYNKNGGWNSSASQTEQCVAYFLPNAMEAVVFVNSTIGFEKESLRGIVMDAFIASLNEGSAGARLKGERKTRR